MDIEFHYYLVYIIARRAGFNDEDSYIIAYSSQHVDDNTIRIEINKGETDAYSNYISQTMNIIKPREKLMRIYPCFHFIPGDLNCDSAKRKDGKLHILNTTPNSPNANNLFDKALVSKNLYRIGICTHSYADTWAHQNFVGYLEYINGMGKVSKGLIQKLTPNIGHADAQHQPDIPGLVWEDGRLIKENREVHNTIRFLGAAESIFFKFRSHLKPGEKTAKTKKDWSKLKKDLEDAIGQEFEGSDHQGKKRIDNYKSLMPGAIDYHQNDWFDGAVERKGRLVFPDKFFKKPGFKTSHWFQFQEAVKEHQRYANQLYSAHYSQLEVKEY